MYLSLFISCGINYKKLRRSRFEKKCLITGHQTIIWSTPSGNLLFFGPSTPTMATNPTESKVTVSHDKKDLEILNERVRCLHFHFASNLSSTFFVLFFWVQNKKSSVITNVEQFFVDKSCVMFYVHFILFYLRNINQQC